MLAGTTWVLEHGSATAEIEFGDDAFWGTDGCNRVRGRYESDEHGGRVVGPVMATRMACFGDADELAATVGPLLADGTRLEIDGDELVVAAEATTLRFTRFVPTS